MPNQYLTITAMGGGLVVGAFSTLAYMNKRPRLACVAAGGWLLVVLAYALWA